MNGRGCCSILPISARHAASSASKNAAIRSAPMDLDAMTDLEDLRPGDSKRRWILARLRAGELTAVRVEAAARCGDQGALDLFSEERGSEDEWPGLELLDDREQRLFACDCAEAVLQAFETEYPDDHRPRKAIVVARLFARGATDAVALAVAWKAAKDAARAAALDARDSAWAAARAASDTAWAANEAAARAAGAAATAVPARRREQLARLASYLLRELDPET